ncbi:MAG: DUF2284 domain-containing protein [Oscillospiraceae bacterium]|nr:DUF2284 domain-containing protein [Oscillospiraceae bacterium]
MTDEQLRNSSQSGFSAAVVIPTAEIPFDFSFRKYCEENTCGEFGKNHGCPPTCGTPEELRDLILGKSHALVLQTVWDIADFSDTYALTEAKNAHSVRMLQLAAILERTAPQPILVGAGPCIVCPRCRALDGEPCCDMEHRMLSMSACCVHVKALAEKCGMPYEWKPGRIYYFGMYVYNK